jgi:K+-transporting ATPase ATPase C chain
MREIMFTAALKQLKTGFILLIFFSILTGLIYPAVIAGIAQLLFPWRANGSLIAQNNKIIGSELIGQSFTDTKYFWSRPSATTPFPYNAAASSGSNLGPTNPDFLASIKSRVENLQQSNSQQQQNLIPVDLVTASGSGLDPDISPAAAFYQVARIAKVRNIPEKNIQELITKLMIPRVLGILGEPRVNVLQLNLALDNLTIKKASQ